jgi:hypothetical protein
LLYGFSLRDLRDLRVRLRELAAMREIWRGDEAQRLAVPRPRAACEFP